MTGIYRNPTHSTVEIPDLDLLTILFDSPHCLAEDDTVVHISAEYPTQSLNKLQLLEYTESIAYCLRHEFGIGSNGPGKDIVTVISEGQPLAPAAFFGVIAAGGVYSSAHATATSSDIVRQLKISGSNVWICSRGSVQVVSAAANQLGLSLRNLLVLESYPFWRLSRLDDNVNLLGCGRLSWSRIVNRQQLEKNLIVIVWSSGTTGVPKGVKLSHRNLVAQTYITHLLGRESADQEVAKGTYIPYIPRTLAHLPASHIAGLFGYFVSGLYAGGVTVWMAKYEWKAFLRYMKEYEVTTLFTVPSIWQRIAKSSDVTDELDSVIVAQSGSAPFDSKLQQAASARLRTLVAPTWGLSETTGGVTIAQSDDKDEVGTLGSLLPGLEVRLVDDEFEDVPEGQPGELLVRGPTVMQGYFGNEAATRDAFHMDWLKTGDIAKVEDGRFIMVDRKKDLLKYKGQQIAPVELEALLCTHPDIVDTAVVGVPAAEDTSSELPRAYVVKLSSSLTKDQVSEFVESRMASYKKLRGGVVFVDMIPRNDLGKILRRELAARAKRETNKSSWAKL